MFLSNKYNYIQLLLYIFNKKLYINIFYQRLFIKDEYIFGLLSLLYEV